MVVLIISFGIWGVGDVLRGNPLQRTVATVGAETLAVQDLSRAFNQSLAEARQMLGPELTAQDAKQRGFLDMTLNNLIAKSTVGQEVRQLGLDVSVKTMLNVFASIPQFRDKDGKFNKELMLQRIGSAGRNERDFVNQQRDDMARRQLIDIFVDPAPIPQIMLDTIYKARGQKRVLEIVTLANTSIAGLATPDEATLRDFYDHHQTAFTAPEYRAVTIARLTSDDVAKDISISDDQLRQAYETKSAQLDRPEQRDLLQVVLQDEAKAKTLAAAAQASGNLATTAKASGYEAIALGTSDKNSLLPDISAPVFALKAGQISAPIKSSLGWHIMQVKKIIPAGKPSFESMKESLRQDTQRDAAIDAVTKQVNQLDDELAAGHGLEDIADALKLRLIKIPALDANGLTPDGKAPAELPNKDDVLRTAFGQNSGETGPVMDDKNGNYFVIRTDDVTPSAVKPFDTIKTDIAAAWKADAQATRAKAEAEKIAEILREGKPAKALGARKGLEVRISKPVSQLGDSDPTLPAQLMPQILAMKKGDAITWSQPDKQLILRLVNILEADDSANASGKGRVTQELGEDGRRELTAQYLKHLRRLFPVSIKQDAVDSVVSSGG